MTLYCNFPRGLQLHTLAEGKGIGKWNCAISSELSQLIRCKTQSHLKIIQKGNQVRNVILHDAIVCRPCPIELQYKLVLRGGHRILHAIYVTSHEYYNKNIRLRLNTKPDNLRRITRNLIRIMRLLGLLQTLRG